MAADASRSAEPAGLLRHRMLPLLAGRLVLAFVILVGALALTAERAREGAIAPERGLYTTVILAFVSTILAAGANGPMRRRRSFAAAQLASDVAIVSALVHFSGGAESFFAFLYVPITVYAALLFGRRGAYAASALGGGGLRQRAVARALGVDGAGRARPPIRCSSPCGASTRAR